MSIHVYLSISPRRNWLRFVPLSRMISARAARSGRQLMRRAPPSPARDVLRFVEARGRKIAESPSRPVLVRGPQGLRRILDDQQVVPPCEGDDLVHLTGHAGIVHRHDGACPRRQRRVDGALVEVQRVGPDVDEDRHAAPQHERVRRRHERERGHDHFVARQDVAEQRGHFQRPRTGMRQQRLDAAHLRFQPRLAAPREDAVAGDMRTGDGFADVVEFPAG